MKLGANFFNVLHCRQYCRLWSTGAFTLYFTSQDLPWLHHTAELHTKHIQSTRLAM